MNENVCNTRPQDDIPYEVRMKVIIESHRKLEERLETLKAYARKLERKVDDLNDKLAKKKMSNQSVHEKFVLANREKKRYKARCEWLEGNLRECETLLMENHIPVPKRNNLIDDTIQSV